MALEVQTKTLGGMKFKMTQLPAWTAFKAFHRFLAVAGPLFPALAGAAGSAIGKKKGNPLTDEQKKNLLDALAKGLPEALAKCTPDELENLARQLLAPCIVTTPDGKNAELLDVVDSVMTGKLPLLLQLIGWAAAVHFGDFLPALGSLGAPAEAADPSPSTSPKT